MNVQSREILKIKFICKFIALQGFIQLYEFSILCLIYNINYLCCSYFK
jgi:hypothetical protein